MSGKMYTETLYGLSERAIEPFFENFVDDSYGPFRYDWRASQAGSGLIYRNDAGEIVGLTEHYNRKDGSSTYDMVITYQEADPQ